MDKLTEVFHTDYFPAHYANEVNRYLQTVTEVDLSGAHICRDTMKHLLSASERGVMIHDTVNTLADVYFEEARRRMNMRDVLKATASLPMPESLADVIPTIRKLDPDEIYHMDKGAMVSQQAFAIIVQAVRPEIQLNLESYVGEVLALVYANLFPSNYHWDKFYVVDGTTFVVEEAPVDDYDRYVSEHIVVPTVFGQERLSNKPEWERCINAISSILEKSMRPKNHKLSDYLSVDPEP